MKESICPACRQQVVWHECISEPGALPAKGDVTVCDACGDVSEFQADLSRKSLHLEKFDWSKYPKEFREAHIQGLANKYNSRN
jgi:uncharacterized Zn finger protein